MYVKHLAYSTAKWGRNVVVINYRGLGGVPLTSDHVYDVVRTVDVREVIRHLHSEYPDAPIFAVGTSVGANLLVKYLGEEGKEVPIAGAAAICSPYDLVVCDRGLHRGVLNRLYDRGLIAGLKDYTQLHKSRYTRLCDFEGIQKSQTIREFDAHAACLAGNYATPDTYYRKASSCNYVANVAVPLLCINALDDPVCTSEGIPWDECRLNKNIVLATTQHGGHLGYFEGVTASRLWWVRAVNEFLGILHSSQYMHIPEKGLSQQENGMSLTNQLGNKKNE